MTAKAIETIYRGVRFRSRTEARWAVFMDACGVRWEYEKEAFDLPAGRYCPDFWLPDLLKWLEIKPTAPDEREAQLAGELAEATRHVVVTCWQPFEPPDGSWSGGESGMLNGGEDNNYWWCVCSCGRVGIEFEGRSARICRHDSDDRGHNYADPKLIAAYQEARGSFRWEAP